MTVPRFWRKIRNRYNLEGTKCRECENTYFPPRNLCPTCRRDGDITDYKFDGDGELVTYTVIRTAAESHEKETPYIIGIVELEEGTSFTSQIVNCEIDEVEIGMKLEPVFRKISQESEEGLIYYGIKYQPCENESTTLP
ncbi:Zn-ribbon domain-containing OB-fold protein [Methanonatronarchaeum sp. AMET6-2]|uniref:Zn-ribbon domain-containing OB-fold protein n=1 Tax=Methanonatronarchaeum sp. AMET6-2 TaxID=2933293 RepID=UPI00121D0A2E|nr:Zn-ribbon domain-containing OB-fold protein [Methanonatronarchaeum sp. AMET6-2]RZN62442.1 MAG: Zn-ribbon domain-containing OB-fold protein [Methanonatronarchaeia archaeon]UOY09687.1 Zn-ribbon domain-containing OB-fold protein [Methanonatronarchaeum sp. AMET6-2]